MIIDTSYFQGEIFLPNIGTSPSSEDGSLLKNFIQEYEEDCLGKCFGYDLYKEFTDQFDESGELKSDADEKWDQLLNGYEYELSGKIVKWNGLIQEKEDYKRSLIAQYVFFYYIQHESFTGVGPVRENANNAEPISIVPKAVRAWRKFYDMTVGDISEPTINMTSFGVAIDYLGEISSKRSLYQFLEDSGEFHNWQPFGFQNINQFDI